MATSFCGWIERELAARAWRQADLARAAHLDPSLLSKILNEERPPTPNTCTAIARALRVPPVTVFRKAGLLPETTISKEAHEKLLSLLSHLSSDDQSLAVSLVNALVNARRSR